MRQLLYSIVCCTIFNLNALAQDELVDFSLDNETSDTLLSSDLQENEFQENIGSLYQADTYGVDTLTWNTKHINVGRFDSKKLTDTIKILLTDSLQNRTYVHPFKNVITSDFGSRNWLWHYGVDIRLDKGDTVRSAFDGVVRVRQYDRHGYGIVIVVHHANGLETIYGHLSKTWLNPNQTVKAGEMIGLGGSTGRSTGNHLHFETRYGGEPFDPNFIIDFERCALRRDTLDLTKSNFAYLSEVRQITWHKIRKGETLGRLACKYHTSVRMLAKLNHISPRTKLRVGMRLAIGRGRPADGKLSMNIQKSNPKPLL